MPFVVKKRFPEPRGNRSSRCADPGRDVCRAACRKLRPFFICHHLVHFFRAYSSECLYRTFFFDPERITDFEKYSRATRGLKNRRTSGLTGRRFTDELSPVRGRRMTFLSRSLAPRAPCGPLLSDDEAHYCVALDFILFS